MTPTDKFVAPTLLIVSGQFFLREGLRSVLSINHGLRIAGVARSGAEGVKLAAQLSPDVVLLDIDTCFDNEGGNTLKAMLVNAPSTRVVVLADDSSALRLQRMRQAGAAGFLSKCIDEVNLINALRDVIASGVCRPFTSTSARAQGQEVASLSARETEVLELMRRGRSNIEIGKALHISAQTVLTHAKSLFTKLHVSSRTEAVTVGFEQGHLNANHQGLPDGGWRRPRRSSDRTQQ